MTGDRPATGRGARAPEAIALGLFAALQTFLLFSSRDRFSILFWWTGESWPYVAALWLKNLLLASVAFVVFVWLVRITLGLPPPEKRASRLNHALLFLAILAAGIALRFIAPRQIPPGVWVDALFEAEGVLREPGRVAWLGGLPRGVEAHAIVSTEAHAIVSNLYLQFCSLLLSIFGRGDVGILSLSAVGGTLMLPAIYWLGKEVADRRTGLVAMGLAAFAGWPLVFSRWAWVGAMLLPLLSAAAAATLASLRTGRILPAFGAGVFLGLALHTHPTAWAVCVGFVAFAVLVLRGRTAGARRLVAAATAGCLIALFPLGMAYLDHPERIGGRPRDVTLLSPARDVTLPAAGAPFALPRRLAHNLVEYGGLTVWRGDPNPRHGFPNQSAVNPILGVAALVGAMLGVRRARSGARGDQLLLLIAGTSLLAGILSNPAGAPNTLRVYPFAAAVFLFAAATLVRWQDAIARALPVRPALLATLGIVLLVQVETLPFLTDWPNRAAVVNSFCPIESEAGRLRRQLGDAPTIIHPGALSVPIVFETLAAGADPTQPVVRLDRRGAVDLMRSPPTRPFWYVARDGDLEPLRRASWRCPPRRTPTDGSGSSVVRVAPPRKGV